MNTAKQLLLAAAFAATGLGVTANTDIVPDSWVAVDNLGRTTPSHTDAPLKTDKKRTVGIFYVTWHADSYYTFPAPYTGDVTKILEAAPAARMNAVHSRWKYPMYHWGEPDMGYFLSRDPWVIRKDISMLADAGVDVLILDCTNGVMYDSEWETLFSVMAEMQNEGNTVPKICFWVYNGDPVACAESIYKKYYRQNRYPQLWFYWDGKPLFLYNADPSVDTSSTGTYSAQFRSFFTLRNMWWGYYMSKGKRYVGTEDNWSFGFDMHDTNVSRLAPEKRAATHKGRLEEMCVTPAQHSSSLIGKSWTVDKQEPRLNNRDLPVSAYVPWLGKEVETPEAYGIYFQQRWDEALSADPDFIYVNDWNEWTAAKFDTPATFMRRNNPFSFVDQYNAEFNRTIQPALGSYADNYYMQMVQNIRRYKGARPAPHTIEQHTITINGNFDDWDAVTQTYYDTRGDITHRAYNGYGGLHYTNTTGRNDIVLSKAAIDKKNISFYAQTATTLSSHSGNNWMLLFIDADNNQQTGWHGYEYMVNRVVNSIFQTTLSRWNSISGTWEHLANIPMRYMANKLELQIPLEMLEIDPKHGAVNFKWADNPSKLNHILDLCLDGDAAPNRRFAYNFSWDMRQIGIDETYNEASVAAYPTGQGHDIILQTAYPYTIYNMHGHNVTTGHGTGTQTVSLPSAGLYLIRTAGHTIKLAVP